MFSKIKNFFSRIWEKVKKPLVWGVAIIMVPVAFVSAWNWGTALGLGMWGTFGVWFGVWVLSLAVFVLCETLINEWARDKAFKAAVEEMRQSEARRNERVRQYENLRATLHNLNRGMGV